MAGTAGARPVKGGAVYASCNSSIEGLDRGLAIDLAPIRVNTISPGTEAEVADTVLYLMGNSFMTGSTLYPDDGYALR